MESKEILALDVGLKHTGMARASSVARLSEPLRTVATKDLTSNIMDYLESHEVEAVVIGLPRNLKGEDTKQTAWVRDWVDNTKQKFDTTLYWQDEALTSENARKLQTTKFKHQTIDEHCLAAAVILQDFLDTPEAERVVC